MQITLVWFQDLQLLKKKNLIDNQRNTICFQEIARVFQNVRILVQMTLTEAVFMAIADGMVQAGVAGVGSSNHHPFIPSHATTHQCIWPILTENLLGSGLDLAFKSNEMSRMAPKF